MSEEIVPEVKDEKEVKAQEFKVKKPERVNVKRLGGVRAGKIRVEYKGKNYIVDASYILSIYTVEEFRDLEELLIEEAKLKGEK